MATKKQVRGKRNNEKSLGVFHFPVVGLQYSHSEIEAGDKVALEREADNDHDSNAIRVENEDFRKIGYLSRKTAHWLAPLWDRGMIRIGRGTITRVRAGRPEAGADFAIELTPEGAHLLEPRENCEDASQAIHNTLLWALRGCEGWKKPGTVRELANKLEELLDRNTLPESYLALQLFETKANAIERKGRERATESLRDLLRGLRVGPAQHHQGVSLYPLFDTRPSESRYLLLEDAIRQELAEVTEVGSEGSVPRLNVVNRSNKPMLLPEGEILMGGKQNRVLNITVIVEAGQERLIPVSCVERGRWRQTSRGFASRFYAPPELRSRKAATVAAFRSEAGEALSDQMEVWNNVRSCLARVSADSESESVTDAFKKTQNTLDHLRKNFEIPPGTVGLVLGMNGEVCSLDLYDSCETAQKLGNRVLEAFLLQTVGAEKASRRTPKKAVTNFLEHIQTHLIPREDERGSVAEFSVSDNIAVGNAVMHDGHLCHLYAFPSPSWKPEGVDYIE